MQPLGGTRVALLREPGLPLTALTSLSAREESLAGREEPAEAVETPGPRWCPLCCSSPCGSRAQPEAKKKAPCRGLGLFYALLSAFLFSVASLLVKKVQDLHAVEISAFRCVFQMLVLIPCLIYRKTGFLGPRDLRIFLILRGVLGSTGMILLYYAFHTTSLANATVVSFSCPVFTSLFACVFLKEKYSLWDVLFTAFAIAGVILSVRPPFLFGPNTAKVTGSYSDHLTGTFASFGQAVCAALAFVILRKMGKAVDYFLTIWYFVVAGLLECVIILFALGMWRLPNCGMDTLFLLLLIGLFVLGGQVFLTKALQIEKAGLVALMKTVDVVFAFISQIIFLHNIPTWWTVGGALCVVASSAGAAIRKWCQGSK
ncbi:PREDICTED: solute carrier family 35 member G1-like [Myotis davidii]|uniref:solute carrier family 35 member G1-like n=1 Tax=Myotis davidii TaxID=225400 RepID=UPI00076780DB|nr:PREDICTED: solute carrier family 35 member G1-like [Myotis davidii]